MKYEADGNVLKLNGREIEFPEPIEEVVEFDKAYVVMFTKENDYSIHNIVALDVNENQLWNIADVIKLGGPEAYVGLWKKNDRHVWVRSLSGVETTFDVYTKEVIEKILNR